MSGSIAWRRARREIRNFLFRAGLLKLPEPALDDVDVVIVSYPKSGRTWLRVLIGRAILSVHDLPEDRLLKTPFLTSSANLRTTVFTHDGSDFPPEIDYRRLRADKSKYAGKTVIFLYRDPRDVLVSAWHHAVYRKNSFDGSISKFVRSNRLGIRKVARFYRDWREAMNRHSDFHFLTYRWLTHDTVGQLERLMPVIGLPPEKIDLDDVVKASSFERMREMETSPHAPLLGQGLSSRRDADPRSYKTRLGQVGSYRRHLGKSDLEFVDRVMRENGNPFQDMLDPLRARS